MATTENGVTTFKMLVTVTMPTDQIPEDHENGHGFFVGDIHDYFAPDFDPKYGQLGRA